jgi:hypothetical protein
MAIRMNREELAALARAAVDHDRPISGLARWIVNQWLRKHGYLSSP